MSLLNLKSKQECIPVGCVPPAAVACPGGSPRSRPLPEQALLPSRHTPLGPEPPEQAPPQSRQTPLGPESLEQAPPRTRLPLPMDRHTPVNILPCPKLRLRAVNIQKAQKRILLSKMPNLEKKFVITNLGTRTKF